MQGRCEDIGKEEVEKLPREIGNGTAGVNDTRNIGTKLGKCDMSNEQKIRE